MLGVGAVAQTPAAAPSSAAGQPAKTRGGLFRRAETRPFGTVARPGAVADTIRRPRLDSAARADSVRLDSIASKQSSLRDKVVYIARDSTISSVGDQIVELFGDAKVDYGDIHLTADYIRLNWKTNEVFAVGRKDSTTGKTIGEPVFKQGNETFNTAQIRYNFGTKRAIIQRIVTQQGEGNIRGNSVKKDSLDNLYLRRAFYTTCNLLHPHYGISAPRIKLVQGKGDNKQVISGPFNLVVADVPLPIGLPFGFFPFSEKRKSGVIVPQYGEEPNNRGFYLRDGGYYWAVNDYVGVRFLGQIYSRGGWGLGSQGNYTRKYRYNGSFFLQYNRNRIGQEFGPSRQISNDFRIQWSHAPVSRGGQSFSASVDVSSQNYNQNNEYNPQRYLSNAFGSSVQYSKNFAQAVTSSVNLRLNQNVRTNVVQVTAGYNVGVNQFQPFRRKNAVTPAWYESFRIGMSLNGSVDLSNDLRPQIGGGSLPSIKIVNPRGKSVVVTQRPDSLLTPAQQQAQLIIDPTTGRQGFNPNQRIGVPILGNLPRILQNAQIRNSFTLPITLPNFKIAKYINVTPSVNFQGDLLTKRLTYTFIPDSNGVQIDTTSGLFPAYSYGFSLSTNTRVYGTFYVRKGRLEAIRHTFAPSISLNYTPDLSKNAGLYQRVQINNRGEERYLSRFVNYSSGSIGRVFGASFALTNQLEMKLRAKSDTAKEQFTKVSIFDNFGLSGSYNFVADSFNLSNLSFVANTQILKKYNVSFTSNFDPYAYNLEPGYGAIGRRTSRYLASTGRGLANLQSLNFSLSTSFKPKNKPKTPQPVQQNQPPPNPNTEAQRQFIARNPDLYVDWNLPWSLQVNYQFSYLKNGLAPAQTIQTMNFSGDLSLTEKWKITLQSGWDFVANAPSLTNVSILRDLHCWEAAFNWTPYAGQAARASNYSFELRVKSTLLRDLKLSRRRSFYDYGGGF